MAALALAATLGIEALVSMSHTALLTLVTASKCDKSVLEKMLEAVDVSEATSEA